jgi:ABC-2 type transport system permease protein
MVSSKLWLIVQREYLTRVRTRAFLLGTLLTPLAFGAFFVIQGLMMSYRGGEKKHIALLDEAGYLKTDIPDESGVRFSRAPLGMPLDSLKNAVRRHQYDGVLRLTPLANFSVKKQTFFYYSDDALSPETERSIKRRLEGKIRDFKIDSLRLDRKSLGDLDTDVSLDPEPIDKKDDAGNSMTSGVAMGISFFMGIAMYMLVLVWGSIVMRSVMEEKTNRIVEVMMSSVKPFELMLGKIIGSAGVGLTQLVLWAILNTVIFVGVQAVFGLDAAAAAPPGGMGPGGAATAAQMAEMEDTIPQLIAEISRQNWGYLIGMALLFFLGGYFLYASLFAAVGSAVGDDLGEGQALTFPIMIPVIIAFLLMTTVVIRTPHSPLAVFASIFPLFSPIVMPGRLAFDPPWWQVALSVVTLIGSAIFFVWLSGRIYRVGILLYGKKVSLKEIWKWMFYKV